MVPGQDRGNRRLMGGDPRGLDETLVRGIGGQGPPVHPYMGSRAWRRSPKRGSILLTPKEPAAIPRGGDSRRGFVRGSSCKTGKEGWGTVDGSRGRSTMARGDFGRISSR